MNIRRYITRRRFLAASAASVAAGMGIYTLGVEPHWLEVVNRAMPIANLPVALAGATLVHVSDLHIGPQVDDDYLLGVFDRIRELAPHFVVYTGDFVSSEVDLQDHAPRLFERLAHGTLGTVGILGNHDYGPGWRNDHTADEVVSLAQNAGVRILRNDQVNVKGLTLVGMDELWADRFNPNAVLPHLHSDDASLVLVHNPDTVDRNVWGSYSGWILAGHTHGGQCKPPFLPPPILPVQNRRYTCGEFALSGSRRLYISRGVGYLMRARFNVRPELTVFTLEQQQLAGLSTSQPSPPHELNSVPRLPTIQIEIPTRRS